MTQLGMQDAVTNGRNGFGSILLFASGNGGTHLDWCSYDGYANSIYTITVGAVDFQGRQPAYGEPCPAQLVAAYTGSTAVSGMNIVNSY